MKRLSLKTALFTWTNVGSAQTPAARADALMIPGPCVDFVSLVGGRGAFRTGWTTGGYDPDSHALLVFGGYRLGPDQGPDTPGSQLFGPTNYTNDLWSLDLDTFTWTELHPQGASPSNRDNAASFFDASRGRLVTFGGEQFAGERPLVLLGGGQPLDPGDLPARRRDPPGAHRRRLLRARDRDACELYIHGGGSGEGGGVLLNDLWKLTWPKN